LNQNQRLLPCPVKDLKKTFLNLPTLPKKTYWCIYNNRTLQSTEGNYNYKDNTVSYTLQESK